MMRLGLYFTVLVVCLGLGLQQARAIPILQLYVEGGQYDPATETWVITPPGSSGGAPFRIWAVGNVAGPGSKGIIEGVRISVAYSADLYSEDELGVDVTLTPSQAGGLGVGEFDGFTDPSVPGAPTLNTTIQTSLGVVAPSDGVVTNGGTPVLGDGKNLPAHGIFGPDTVWQEYALGDFTLTDSPVGDFIGSFPTDLTANAAQINAYEVYAMGLSGATLHFDLYDTVLAGNHVKGKFAPFSHDADGEANIIPEPASIAVWSLLGLVAVAAAWWRRAQKGT